MTTGSSRWVLNDAASQPRLRASRVIFRRPPVTSAAIGCPSFTPGSNDDPEISRFSIWAPMCHRPGRPEAFHLVQSILDLQVDAPNHRLYVDAQLPKWLPDVTLHRVWRRLPWSRKRGMARSNHASGWRPGTRTFGRLAGLSMFTTNVSIHDAPADETAVHEDFAFGCPGRAPCGIHDTESGNQCPDPYSPCENTNHPCDCGDSVL
jgi:hypothetical protein